MKAGRMMLEQIQQRLIAKETFAIETTLASRIYLNLVKQAQLLGYEVVLFFFYLPSADMAKERVKLRVSKGGHNIPPDVIERRYVLGIQYLFEYIKIVNNWFVYKNDHSPPLLISEGEIELVNKIHNFEIWQQLKQIRDSQ